MGCHTWFRNEWKYIPKKDIKFLIKKYDEDYKCRFIKNQTFDEYRRFNQEYYDECIQSGDIELAKYLRNKINSKTQWKKKRKEDDRYKCIHRHKISRHELIRILRKLDWVYYPDKYYNVPGYHDNFRIHDYDAEPWYSLEDFEKYIEQNPDTIVTYYKVEGGKFVKMPDGIKYAKSIIKEFFEKYPHGVIELG